MTEKELFTNALRENLQDPSELSEEEILQARRNGRLRQSCGKYIAAAAAAAIAVGCGAFFLSRDAGTVPQAEDIRPSASQAVTAESFETVFYNRFWKDMLASPEDYYASAYTYEGKRVIGTAQTSLSENCFNKINGQDVPKAIAEYFASAKNVEYLGYRSPLDDKGQNTVTVDKAVTDLIYGDNVSQISIGQRPEVPQVEDIDCECIVADGSAYIILTRASRADGYKDNSYFYKVTSEDGSYPFFNGRYLSLPEWEVNHSDRCFVKTAEEFRAQNGTEKFTVTDAENKVGFTYTVDLSNAEYPAFDITDIILPEGVDIKDGRFTVQLETKDNFGKHCTFTQNAELKAGRIETSCKALGVSPEDIISVSVKAVFDTTEHETDENYKPEALKDKASWQYAYTLRAYVGADRSTE